MLMLKERVRKILKFQFKLSTHKEFKILKIRSNYFILHVDYMSLRVFQYNFFCIFDKEELVLNDVDEFCRLVLSETRFSLLLFIRLCLSDFGSFLKSRRSSERRKNPRARKGDQTRKFGS